MFVLIFNQSLFITIFLLFLSLSLSLSHSLLTPHHHLIDVITPPHLTTSSPIIVITTSFPSSFPALMVWFLSHISPLLYLVVRMFGFLTGAGTLILGIETLNLVFSLWSNITNRFLVGLVGFFCIVSIQFLFKII